MPKARPRRFPPQRGPRPRRRPSRGNTAPQAPVAEAPAAVAVLPEGGAPVSLPKTMQVGELAQTLDLSIVDVIRALVNMGVMATINQTIDFETASLVAGELGLEVVPEEEIAPPVEEAEELAPVGKEILWTDDDASKMITRPPVVTIVGHVDHGKTSLLDAIRETNVTAREAGGITQHIGAYQIEHSGRKVTFLDTPGHEAFTAMRPRGAHVADLKANPDRPAIGRVIEAHMDKSRGPIATVLVQTGTLERGDLIVVGKLFGKVRAMTDDKAKSVGRAEPSRPVLILGLPDVPEAGDVLRAVADEKTGKALADRNARERAAAAGGERPATLDEMFAQVKEGKAKELKLVLKADVQGSLEAIKGALAKVPQEEVALVVIHDAVGDISESDVTLAAASGAVVIGFNNKIDVPAKRAAEQTKVDVRQYKVIYELLDDIQKARTGMLEPEMVESILGHAEVRQIFTANKTTIAGCMVSDGLIRRGAQARLLRGQEPAWEGTIATLRRVKDDVREGAAGLVCGIVLEGHNDVTGGEVIAR